MKEDEEKLQPTRHRSLAAKRHSFDFVAGYEKSIVPIYKLSNDGTMEIIGTGFFVAENGIIATAKHVFEGKDIKPTDKFEIQQVSDNTVFIRPIINITKHPITDLALAELGAAHEDCIECIDHPIVSIMELPPEKDEVVASFTFSHTVVHEAETHDFKEGKALAQKVKYRSHWEVGLGLEFHPNGFMFVKGKCFTTSIFVEGRGSGGPVFNSNGFVVGVNSSGGMVEPGDKKLPHSTINSISEIMDMQIGDKSIRQLRKACELKWPNNPIAIRKSLF